MRRWIDRTRGQHKTRGQTLVEVTLIIPLLIVLVGAALDWGLVFFVSHVVQNAVRSGARVAVTQNSPVSEAAVEAEVQRVIPNTALFSAFRSSANIQVTCIAGSPPFLRVRVSNNGNPIAVSFYFMRILGLTNASILRETAMKYERDLVNCPAIT
jgi:Flp pilus assembly protein TadG